MPKQHELLDMQQDITQEVNGDAPILAKSLFGDKMPDMGTTSDTEALDMMRQKFTEGDRAWLVNEAHRDPDQFMRLSKQLGVVAPPAPPASPIGAAIQSQ